MKKSFVMLFAILVLLLSSCTNNTKNIDVGDAWHLTKINVNAIWQYSDGETQTVAFIDTGISDYLKNLYKDRITNTYNVFDKSENVLDENAHGTEMVSIACGNGQGNVWGVAPKTKIIVIKAIDSSGKVSPSYISAAIEYAVSKNATIINMSFGGHISNDKIIEAINMAVAKNITVVAAAGDYSEEDLLFPANMNTVVSVEAMAKDGSLWADTNTSDQSVCAFPGEDIKAISWNGETSGCESSSTGTSQATAVASGYIALLRDYYEKEGIQYNNTDIINALKTLDTTSGKKINFALLFK